MRFKTKQIRPIYACLLKYTSAESLKRIKECFNEKRYKVSRYNLSCELSTSRTLLSMFCKKISGATYLHLHFKFKFLDELPTDFANMVLQTKTSLTHKFTILTQ